MIMRPFVIQNILDQLNQDYRVIHDHQTVRLNLKSNLRKYKVQRNSKRLMLRLKKNLIKNLSSNYPRKLHN